MKLEGPFGLYHIIYLIIFIILTILGLIIIKKKVNNEKTLDTILRITASLLLIAVTINRISAACYKILEIKTETSWAIIIPNSICGMSSFVLSISVLINPRKNNPVFHFVLYMGLIGGLVTIIYPDFLESQPFSIAPSWSGLLHHSIMLFLTILLLVEDRFRPSLKKSYIAPLGYMFYIIFGLLNMSIFSISNSMNIKNPLLKSLPVLTSWYMLGIEFTVTVYLISFIYEYKIGKIKFKKDIKKEEIN